MMLSLGGVIRSATEDLRRNDPTKTYICITLRHEPSDAAVAQALEQNPFVTYIRLDVYGEQRADWNSLLRVIATRANLETVNLWKLPDLFDVQDAMTADEDALVRSILRAMQQNPAIRNVDFQEGVRLPSNMSEFVDTASSITSFCLYNCDMDPAEREQGVRDLAAAIQQNANIETLQLGCNVSDDFYTVPILEGLRSNTAVKTLIVEGHLPDATSHALHQLLQSTTSIQNIGFHDIAFSSESLFRPIAQAITSKECVSGLKFTLCRFSDQSSIAQFRSILQNKRNLSALCLHDLHDRNMGGSTSSRGYHLCYIAAWVTATML